MGQFNVNIVWVGWLESTVDQGEVDPCKRTPAHSFPQVSESNVRFGAKRSTTAEMKSPDKTASKSSAILA